MNQPPSPPPKYEPGGDRIIAVIVVIVVTALGGMLWSFFSRQGAPQDATSVKTRHLPPSARPETGKQVPDGTAAPSAPAPTVPR